MHRAILDARLSWSSPRVEEISSVLAVIAVLMSDESARAPSTSAASSKKPIAIKVHSQAWTTFRCSNVESNRRTLSSTPRIPRARIKLRFLSTVVECRMTSTHLLTVSVEYQISFITRVVERASSNSPTLNHLFSLREAINAVYEYTAARVALLFG